MTRIAMAYKGETWILSARNRSCCTTFRAPVGVRIFWKERKSGDHEPRAIQAYKEPRLSIHIQFIQLRFTGKNV